MTDREAFLSLRRVNFIYTMKLSPNCIKPSSQGQIALDKEIDERLAALNNAGFNLKFAEGRYMLHEPREKLP